MIGIVAVTPEMGIGYKGDLCYKDLQDKEWFTDKVKDYILIAGSVTASSLPRSLRQDTIIISSSLSREDEALAEFLDVLPLEEVTKEWIDALGHRSFAVIGGSGIYNAFAPFILTWFVSEFNEPAKADKFLPIDILNGTSHISTVDRKFTNFTVKTYVNKSAIGKDIGF